MRVYCYPGQMANRPAENKRAVTMRWDREFIARVQRVAAERETTMTDLVLGAVERDLGESGWPPPADV